jgi:hypothetical protein
MTAPPLTPPTLRVACRRLLVAGYRDQGIEVTVSVAAPLVWSPLGSWVCEHGTTYWPAPTAAQTARWALDGAA